MIPMYTENEITDEVKKISEEMKKLEKALGQISEISEEVKSMGMNIKERNDLLSNAAKYIIRNTGIHVRASDYSFDPETEQYTVQLTLIRPAGTLIMDKHFNVIREDLIPELKEKYIIEDKS